MPRRRSSLSEAVHTAITAKPPAPKKARLPDLRAAVKALAANRTPPTITVWHLAHAGDQRRRMYLVTLPEGVEVDYSEVPFTVALSRCELAREVSGRRLLLSAQEEGPAAEHPPTPAHTAQLVPVRVPGQNPGQVETVTFEFASPVLVPGRRR